MRPVRSDPLPPMPLRYAEFQQSLFQSLRGTQLLCLAVAAVLSVLGMPPLVALVYSLCIGNLTALGVHLGRWGITWWQVWRRGSESPEQLQGWPGWLPMSGAIVLAVGIAYPLGSLVAAWLLGTAPPTTGKHYWRQWGALFLVSLVPAAIGTYYFHARARIAATEAELAQVGRLAAETQLRLLQSQLEPHMLFNTLANLRVLITLDPPRAQAMLDRLVAFLRATLGASRAGSHTLAEEFDRLADYLALMGLRMGPRLQVQLDLPEALRTRPVPALLLQPLVENAIRHGLEPQVDGGRLAVAAARQGDRLLLTVRDTGVGLPAGFRLQATAPAASTGAATGAANGPASGAATVAKPGGSTQAGSHYGTQHVAERLATLYGEAARFELLPADDADGGTLARITLPWPADDAGRPAP